MNEKITVDVNTAKSLLWHVSCDWVNCESDRIEFNYGDGSGCVPIDLGGRINVSDLMIEFANAVSEG